MKKKFYVVLLISSIIYPPVGATVYAEQTYTNTDLEATTASDENTNTDLEATTASDENINTDLEATTASDENIDTDLEATTASDENTNTDLEATTASTDGKSNRLNMATPYSYSSVSCFDGTIEQYVSQLLSDDSITVSNISFSGSPKAISFFSNGLSTLGIDSGVILSTGSVQSPMSSLEQPGDADLNSLNGLQTEDAVSIEFDFIPKYSTLNFNYIFGSKEYPKYVGSEYNDTFAFFVNGVNTALLPDTNTFVSINNVNETTNNSFFISNTDNHLGSLPGTSFGGITTVLPISASVLPNQINHIKIVIADTSDSILDSFVAIESNTFKASGKVNVSYKDENGEPLSEETIIDGLTGEYYSVEPKNISGYDFLYWEGEPSGTISESNISITAVYKKKVIADSAVTIQYLDTEGNTIASDVVKNGSIGDSYSSEQLTINGYTFKEVIGNPNGTFTDKDQTVTYVYTKNPVASGAVTIHYLDTEGNTIASNVVKNGSIGDSYSSEQLAINGYTFKEVVGDPIGTFTDKTQTVTYVYTKNPVASGAVTIHYLDTEGNTIASNVVKNGSIGDSYSSEQLTINGYTFKEVIGNPNGTFTDKDQAVTYVYTKNPVTSGSVTIHYLDTEGNTIASDVMKNGSIGDSYSSEQLAINGYTFKEVTGDPIGTFTDKTQTVTYVYTKNKIDTPVEPLGKTKSISSVSKTTSLPQTGEKYSSLLTIIGSMTLLAGGAHLLTIKRKKSN